MDKSLFAEADSKKLFQCFAFSIALHAVALTFFYYHPLLLQGPFESLFNISSSTPESLASEEDFAQKNRSLEEAFERILVLSPHLQEPYDLVALPQGRALAPREEKVDEIALEQEPQLELEMIPRQEILGTPLAFTPADEEFSYPLYSAPVLEKPRASSVSAPGANSSSPSLVLPLVPLPEESGEDFIAVSPFSGGPQAETGVAPLPSRFFKKEATFELKTATKFESLETLSPHLDREEHHPTFFSARLDNTLPEKQHPAISRALFSYSFPPLTTAAEWNDDFTADVVFLPSPEGKGYIFSVSLKPGENLSSYSLKQNIYFILDRSSSVQKHRFSVFKRGVLKALSSMQRGDTFNIFIIDKKVAQFSTISAPVTMKNIESAEEFLEKQEGSGLFSGGDLYGALGKILTNIPENGEIHTAILLTDGKSSLSVEKKQGELKKWTEKNQGRLSLYTAAVGRDNDLLSLDLLSAISGGNLLYSETHAAFPRKLAKLVLDLKDPIAKGLIVSTIPHHPQAHIEFYPAHSQLPTLYGHQPYVLIGQIDHPCAFDLVIQGRHQDQWIAIKKNISFIEGRKGDPSLAMEWSAERAHLYYAKFLKEGKPAHLKEAKAILKKSRSEIAFE